MKAAAQPSPQERVDAWLRLGLSTRWRWHSAEGMCLILLGAFSLLAAPSVGTTFCGTTLLAAGVVTLLAVWRAEQHPAPALSGLLALIAITTGLHLFGSPSEGALGLTFAAYFASRGTVMALLAVALRRRCFSQWEWFAVSGVTGLIMAMMILSGLPGPYTWMLGILLGVGLIFDGSALLALVLAFAEAGATAPSPVFARPEAATLPAPPVCEESFNV
jgi:uncharacterized membrane protein HdeD (DUF308 family)